MSLDRLIYCGLSGGESNVQSSVIVSLAFFSLPDFAHRPLVGDSLSILILRWVRSCVES